MTQLRLMDRRAVCVSGAGLALWPLAAQAASLPPPELAAYERASGGRIGVFAQDLKTGRQIAWRADERFVMCSSFKASLVACVLSRVDRGQERLAGRRLTLDGVLVLQANRFRTQERNRQDALDRLIELIARAAEPPPPPRKKTRPTLASKKRRLEGKTRRGAVKSLRGRPQMD